VKDIHRVQMARNLLRQERESGDPRPFSDLDRRQAQYPTPSAPDRPVRPRSLGHRTADIPVGSGAACKPAARTPTAADTGYRPTGDRQPS